MLSLTELTDVRLAVSLLANHRTVVRFDFKDLRRNFVRNLKKFLNSTSVQSSLKVN